jgi:Na+/H+-dicarboxylate symporter
MSHLASIHPPSLTRLADYLSQLVAGRLWLKVLIGLGLGLFTGFLLGPSAGFLEPELGTLIGNWLALPGMLFLASIRMIVVPLVFASIILGLTASENVDQLRRVGLISVGYFLVTTAIAACVGLWIAGLVRPGDLLADQIRSTGAAAAQAVTPQATIDVAELPERLVRLLPGNPLSSMAQGDMLEVVIFAVIVGIALVALPLSQSKLLIDLLGAVQQVCMTVVKWAMRLAPIAVFGLMARLTSQFGLEALAGMGLYVATVLGGLTILMIMYLGIVWALAGERPLAFLKATRELLLLAFSTSSSAAVMPLSIKTAEEALQVRPSIAQFVIPLGATINMNGTALYQGVAAMFLAQAYGIDVGLSSMALIVAMAVGASVGSPATPGVGIVVLAMVVGTIGVPAEGVALLLGVDRILDMSRTAINVAGDLVASKVMNRWLADE